MNEEQKAVDDNKLKKVFIITFALLGLYAFIRSCLSSNELEKYGVIVEAQVYNVSPSRGAYEVDVKYNVNNRTYQNDFGTYKVDSLKKGVKVKILISKRKPDGPMKYLYLSR